MKCYSFKSTVTNLVTLLLYFQAAASSFKEHTRLRIELILVLRLHIMENLSNHVCIYPLSVSLSALQHQIPVLDWQERNFLLRIWYICAFWDAFQLDACVKRDYRSCRSIWLSLAVFSALVYQRALTSDAHWMFFFCFLHHYSKVYI